MVRPPMAPSFLFLLDVSGSATSSGATAAACLALKRSLGDLPGGARCQVGVATFDSTLHFYRLPPGGGQPHMLVVADVAEPYAPLPAGLVVPLAENREALEGLLDAIPGLFAGGRPGENAGGAALQAGLDALKAAGGRCVLLTTGLPTAGAGALRPRDGRGEGEKDALKSCAPGDKGYAKLAMEAAEYQVAFDVYLMATGPCEVATLAGLCTGTGGSLYSYPAFNATLDFSQLHNDLRWNFSRPQGLEAVARLRVSQGLAVTDYEGAFCKRTPTDVDLPAVDCDKALLVSLKHEDRLNDGAEACLQFAMLYTTVEGERRIRVHTLAVAVTGVLANLFRAADLDVQLAVSARKVAAAIAEGATSLTAIKDKVLADAVSALYAYRRFCATNSSAGQLILPEALKLLPLYSLGLLKSAGLRPESGPDERSAWAARHLSLSAAAVVPSFYGRLFPVAQLPVPNREDGRGGSVPSLPPTTWLSSEKLEAEGVYLLENSQELFIWAGSKVPPAVLEGLLGVSSVEALHSGAMLQPPASAAGEALHALINHARQQRSSYMRLRLLRRPDVLEARERPTRSPLPLVTAPFFWQLLTALALLQGAFFACMIEDRSTAGMSYVEFLCHVHRQIQARFV